MWKNIFAPKKEISKGLYSSAGLLAFILFLLTWSLLSYSGIVNPLFLPSPGKVINTAIDLFSQGDILKDIGISFTRVGLGFLLAAVIGVPLGILMGTLRIMEGFFEPIMGFIRYMPASAFIPLFILWIGLDEGEKMSVIFFGTFFQLTLMVMDVTKNVQNELIDVSYTLGASKAQIFSKVILPSSLPGIVDTLRITFGWAWTYLVVAEIVGASSGLGYMIMQSSRFLRPDKIFVGIIIIGLLGLVTDIIFKFIYSASFSWMRKEGV
ncbi:ABC-type nitrate/sulfonate/bicarbonate transport system, permease component [Desulfosporosinus orientis DSM 765]|uniref:ABC-type nitrate/sulfonate/bicarbonate transport system, permease component n=1 Tax=Desulfosporosinus orientis (strain ATCC 19365 / DSM 765 / NCIMB 8382 / VKM B-1628 / Singapore I) TaxID=768706 RepID=G7WJ44_DESOD|nr:ABC transporter permease [Desulfosporosinus orientis]AET70356.1 ABC-type nitrate/sulfonate/bicarbonate transport system, permease component [Desulfosporosinus orientis DSM 765]